MLKHLCIAAVLVAAPAAARAEDHWLTKAEITDLLVGKTVSFRYFLMPGVLRSYYSEGDTQLSTLNGSLPQKSPYHIENGQVCYRSACIAFRRAANGKILVSDKNSDVGELIGSTTGDVDHMGLKVYLPRITIGPRS